jgi:CBS domain-containing protein
MDMLSNIAIALERRVSAPVYLYEQNDAGRLPVLEDGKLVGLITRTDLLRHHNFYDR